MYAERVCRKRERERESAVLFGRSSGQAYSRMNSSMQRECAERERERESAVLFGSSSGQAYSRMNSRDIRMSLLLMNKGLFGLFLFLSIVKGKNNVLMKLHIFTV